MTSQHPSLSSGEGTITYWLAQGGNRGITETRERFDELTSRDIMARALATLKARGTYDPARHADPGKYQPLTVAEHLQVLAYGEVLARYYRHPASVDRAVKAGATWPQIAEAVGSDEARVRQQHQEWADGQHDLYLHYEGKLGMNDAEHAAAIERASEPSAAPGVEREPGNEPVPRSGPRKPTQGTGAMKQPPGLGAHPLAAPRPPEHVTVSWANEQLRDRIQCNNADLAQELQDRDRRRYSRRAGPDAEPEAEP